MNVKWRKGWKKMKKNYSLDIGILTVSEMIEMLQSLSPKYKDWPIYCCGSGACYMAENDIGVKHINIHSDYSVDVPKMREYVWRHFPNVGLPFNLLQF